MASTVFRARQHNGKRGRDGRRKGAMDLQSGWEQWQWTTNQNNLLSLRGGGEGLTRKYNALREQGSRTTEKNLFQNILHLLGVGLQFLEIRNHFVNKKFALPKQPCIRIHATVNEVLMDNKRDRQWQEREEDKDWPGRTVFMQRRYRMRICSDRFSLQMASGYFVSTKTPSPSNNMWRQGELPAPNTFPSKVRRDFTSSKGSKDTEGNAFPLEA